MTPENQKKYDEKLKRIKDATALKEPDRVPICPVPELYPIYNAGYTVAEVIYDTSLQKSRNAAIKYLTDFDPDTGTGAGLVFAGEGPAMERIRPKNMRWAGMPGAIIDENSLQQFIEYPLLLDDEYEEFFKDRTGWALKKALPRVSGLFDPLADFQYNLGNASRGARQLASLFSTPAYRAMIQDFWAIEDFYQVYQARVDEINQMVYEMGYPVVRGGAAGVPFDFYSDFLRGTLLACADLYDRPEDVQRYIDEALEVTLENIRATKGQDEGKHISMALHKGMDGFMSDEHYRKYYWSHLQKIILAIIDSGKVPYIYTEGKYNTRIDCLTEVPPGKVIYHFEEVDIQLAKKELDGIACIRGAFPANTVVYKTPSVIDEKVKETMDILAPGGGYLFSTGYPIEGCPVENMEALLLAVEKYGKY
ncbi:MAG: hypothetical protein FWH28_06880 [Clostridiales bacterium]|nr:hypothetical protein [Clostridiales bacterium]